MSNTFQIKIKPYEFYKKYAAQNYVLCSITFDFIVPEKHSFSGECNNRCLAEILSTIDDYFNGKIENDMELCYDVPWIIGGVEYPYSFQINVAEKQWIFRYKKNMNDPDFDFLYPMNDDALRSMRTQIAEQYAKMDWQSLGKSHLYTFDLPQKEFEWCYSAKAFAKALNALCRGREIQAVYVSAADYADPLSVRENDVNYYYQPELFIQLDSVLLNLLIHASGLFQWRVFDNSEFSVIGPRVDFIQDGELEFCKIHDAYQAFRLEYCNSRIEQVGVQATDDWPWSAEGFDESKLGTPIELPRKIYFKFENGNTLSFDGGDDDFAIQIKDSLEA